MADATRPDCKPTADELQRLDRKHSCLLQLQYGCWQMGEREFKEAVKQPGELRNATLALIAIDQSAAVNKGQLATAIAAASLPCHSTPNAGD